MKHYLPRLHRWIALLFSLPLLAIVVTGLLLSFEPWMDTRAIQPGHVTAARIEDVHAVQNPSGQVRAISYRSYDATLTIGGPRGAGGIIVDVAPSTVVPAPSRMASILGTARRLHETLLLDMRWLVISSTAAMAAVIILGSSRVGSGLRATRPSSMPGTAARQRIAVQAAESIDRLTTHGADRLNGVAHAFVDGWQGVALSYR